MRSRLSKSRVQYDQFLIWHGSVNQKLTKTIWHQVWRNNPWHVTVWNKNSHFSILPFNNTSNLNLYTDYYNNSFHSCWVLSFKSYIFKNDDAALYDSMLTRVVCFVGTVADITHALQKLTEPTHGISPVSSLSSAVNRATSRLSAISSDQSPQEYPIPVELLTEILKVCLHSLILWG